MNEVPQLRTARLLLRGFEERDFNAYAAMMADLGGDSLSRWRAPTHAR